VGRGSGCGRAAAHRGTWSMTLFDARSTTELREPSCALKNSQVPEMFIPRCGGSSEMGRCALRAHWPVLGGMVRGGSISELKGVFSLFTSEMSSETATLKPLRWISELT
jgi:hypothetical protein